MKDKIFGVLQRIGRSFMLPIAILPVAGLLLGLGSSFTNTATIETFGLGRILGNGTVLHALFVIMNRVGSAIFDNLPLIFAVGVAIGMARREKEVAALSALIAFFVMHISINGILNLSGVLLNDGTVSKDILDGTIASVCGIQTLQMGVFGGILVGLGVAALHNRFYKIQFPSALSFFGGSRFVPIISTIVYMLVGILMYFLWPMVQSGIYALGGLVTGTGYFGTLIFGIVKRALIPFGLHHVFYLPFWQTAVGGTMEVSGQLIQGGQNIFFAQLADSANLSHFSADATRYFSGEFIFMIFGLPGAALAMYRTARPEKKKAAGGLLLSAALTSMLTGITEPIEFSFLFAAPILFGVQVLLAGTAYMVAHILNIAVGLTFSGGFIDLLLFGILQGNAKTDWIRILPVGVIYFFLYYGIFAFLIRRLDLKTPGREEDSEETKLHTRADVMGTKTESPAASVSSLIVQGLGGRQNICDVDCCATRLRITVADPTLVQGTPLKQSGSRGIVRKGNGIQIIYGPQVAVIRSELEDFLEMSPDSASGIQNSPEHETTVFSPADGTLVPLKDVADGVFSEGILGPGAAIDPSEGRIYAPFDGIVTMIFETKHAISLTSDSGIEVLIHIGIDTVNLKGKYFSIQVKEGDHVRKGAFLAAFDLERIQSEGYRTITPMIVTNAENFYSVSPVTDTELHHADPMIVVRSAAPTV
ncbi:MAG: glucose PTS transporter subunit IIA [Blautia sp.]|nr:glucose PTS transporter subunit IIA [Blautia sp.]MDY5030494.1 glucose PTS transporter subunit IIA [Blautia sp.]